MESPGSILYRTRATAVVWLARMCGGRFPVGTLVRQWSGAEIDFGRGLLNGEWTARIVNAAQHILYVLDVYAEPWKVPQRAGKGVDEGGEVAASGFWIHDV